MQLQYAHGFIDPREYADDPALFQAIQEFNALEKLVDYCWEHADSPNPIQNLVDKGLMPPTYADCKEVKNALDVADTKAAQLMRNYTAMR